MMRRLWWRFFGHGSGNQTTYLRQGRRRKRSESTSTASWLMTFRLHNEAARPEQQAVTHARRVHLHAQKVDVGCRLRTGEECLAVTETDLEYARGAAAETCIKVERRLDGVDAKGRPQNSSARACARSCARRA